MSLREQWIRPLDALPQDYQHVIAITSSGQEEEMYLVDDKWHIVDGVRIPIEFVVFWHEKREQPTVEMAEDCITKVEVINTIHKIIYGFFDIADDDSEEPINDKDKLLLTINKAISNAVKVLPSVTPSRPRGKWIDIGMWLEGKKYGKEYGEMIDAYSCDYCGYSQYHKTNFCPNCGCYCGGDDNVDE